MINIESRIADLVRLSRVGRALFRALTVRAAKEAR